MAERLYFFWDYNITDEDIQEILRSDNETEKVWVITRLLQSAQWEDIWKYITLDDIRENFGRIQFRTPDVRNLWAHALAIWSQADE